MKKKVLGANRTLQKHGYLCSEARPHTELNSCGQRLSRGPNPDHRGKSLEYLPLKCTHSFFTNTQGKPKVTCKTFLNEAFFAITSSADFPNKAKSKGIWLF